MAFTDLMQAAVGLLPRMAPFADRDELARLTAAARSSPDFHRWPPACVELLEACEAILDKAHPMKALRTGEIGRAAKANDQWAEPVLPLWARRRDIGGLEDAA